MGQRRQFNMPLSSLYCHNRFKVWTGVLACLLSLSVLPAGFIAQAVAQQTDLSPLEAMTAASTRPPLVLTFPVDYVAMDSSQIEQLTLWAAPFTQAKIPITVVSYSALRFGYGDGKERIARHEAIRIGYKRAMAVRDTLLRLGIADELIILQAKGPAPTGYAERVEIFPKLLPLTK